MLHDLMGQKTGYIILFFAVTILHGCASHKKINRLVAEIDCNKTIHFALDKDIRFSKIEYRGDHYGDSPYPDYRRSLREAVEELDEISPAKLVYKDALGFPSDSIIQVSVLIENIVWGFGSSSALMEAEIIYKMADREINIMANNKVFVGGTKKGNVFKTLKDGNYKLLSILCDE